VIIIPSKIKREKRKLETNSSSWIKKISSIAKTNMELNYSSKSLLRKKKVLTRRIMILKSLLWLVSFLNLKFKLKIKWSIPTEPSTNLLYQLLPDR